MPYFAHNWMLVEAYIQVLFQLANAKIDQQLDVKNTTLGYSSPVCETSTQMQKVSLRVSLQASSLNEETSDIIH